MNLKIIIKIYECIQIITMMKKEIKSKFDEELRLQSSMLTI